MKDKSKIFIAIIVAAVVVSAYIGGKAIVGSAASLHRSESEPAGAPGEIEATASEASELLADMGGAEGEQKPPDINRDPLAAYTGPAPSNGQAAAPRPARPSIPAYTVTAVFLDDNPTAILVSADGGRTIVHVGDEVGGGRVTGIAANGVTIEGADGAHTYPY
jgi:hypothetical protein